MACEVIRTMMRGLQVTRKDVVGVAAAIARVLLLIAISWPVAVLLVFGTSMFDTGWVRAEPSELYANAGALTFAIAAIILLSEWLLRRLCWHNDRFPRLLDVLAPQLGVKSVLAHALVLFALWSFWLVAFCPGSMLYDTYYQICQSYPEDSSVYFGVWNVPGVELDAHFSDHHPILDTLIYGFAAQVSEVQTGSWNTGLFALATFQTLASAICFSYALAVARDLGAPRSLCVAVFLLVGLVPIFGHYASLNMKDSIFSPIYLLWFTLIARLVNSKGGLARSFGFYVALLVCGVLCALTKKTGVYVVVPTLAAMSLIYWRAWWRLGLQALVVGGVIWVVLPQVVFPALDVAPGGRQEALGPLFQQTARYVCEHGDEMDKDQRKAIDDVLHYDTLAERYEPAWADPVKYKYVYNASQKAWDAYFAVWAQQGMDDPQVYFEAAVAPVAGFVSPRGAAQLKDALWDKQRGGSELLTRPANLRGMHRTASKVFEAATEAPVVDVLMMSALYVIWIPALCLWVCARRSPRWIPLLIPVALTVGAVLMSPMYDTRYALPMIYSAPILLCFCAAGLASKGRMADDCARVVALVDDGPALEYRDAENV